MGEVSIITSRLGLIRIEAEWWVIPASSLVFFFMTVLGLLSGTSDEGMFGFSTVKRWYNTRVLGRSMDIESFICCSDDGAQSTVILRPTTNKLGAPSGWDDSLRFSKCPETIRPKLAHIVVDTPPSPSAYSDTESDSSFIASTLNYVQSPTGRKALGLPSPTKDTIPVPPMPESRPEPKVVSVVPQVDANRLSVIDHALDTYSHSPSNSILSSSWPEPPSTLPIDPVTLCPIPPSPSPRSSPHPSIRRTRSPSISSSLASSAIATSGYTHENSVIPTVYETRPFEDSGVPTDGATPAPRTVRKMRSKDSFASIALNLGRERPSGKGKRVGGLDEGAVYMTVVKETA